MARTVTLAAMLADIRTRTNQEGSTFVTDAELAGYLNTELTELWAHIVQNEGQPHIRSSQPYTVTSSTTSQALPTDFWRVQQVEAVINGVTGLLRPYMASEHGWLKNSGPWSPLCPVMYRVQGPNIEFLPPTSTFTATLYYTPTATKLTLPSDTFDGYDGYEQAAIYGVCATVLQKEESDPSFYLGQKQRIYQIIDSLAAQRDAGSPERVQDVSHADLFVGAAFGWWPV